MLARRRPVGPAVALCLALAGAAGAAPSYVIPPGQEALLQRMLAPPAPWALVSVEVRQDQVVATYAPDKKRTETVRLVLVHPDKGAGAALTTGKFAVLRPAQTAGLEPLLAGVEKGLRAGETAWTWVALAEPGPPPPPPPEEASAPPPRPEAESDPVVTATQAQIRALMDRAREAAHTHKTAEAGTLADEALALRKTLLEPDPWIDGDLGQLLTNLGRADVARPLLTTALVRAAERMERARAAKDPETWYTHAVLRARILTTLGRFEESQAALAELLRTATEDHVCALWPLAISLGETGRGKEALALVAAWTERAPRCQALYFAAMQIAGATELLEIAGPIMEKGARELPDNDLVVRQLSYYYKFKGRREDAVRVLEKLYLKDPSQPGLIAEYLGILTRAGITDQMVVDFKTRADANSESDVLAYPIGVLLHYKERYEESIRYLTQARRAFPRETRIFIYLAMDHFHLGHQKEAEELIQIGVGLASPDPDVFYCRGLIFQDKDPRAAIQDITTYLERTHGSFDVYPPKEARVRKMLEDHQACAEAKVPSECVKKRETSRTTGLSVVAVAGVAVLLAVPVVIFWRRRRRKAAALVLLGALLGAAPARAEIALPDKLLRDFQAGEGWSLAGSEAAGGKLKLRFGKEGRALEVVLAPRGSTERPFGQTASFDVYYTGSSAGPEEVALARRVVAALEQADPGGLTVAQDAPPAAAPTSRDQASGIGDELSFLQPVQRVELLVSTALLLAGCFFLP